MSKKYEKIAQSSYDFTDVNWESLSNGVSSSKTYRMVLPNNQKLRFSGSYSVFFTSFVMLATSLVIIVFAFVEGESRFLLIVGTIILLLAIHHINLYANPLIFDKQAGVYKKGWQPLLQRLFLPNKKLSVNLEDIIVIQTLKKGRHRNSSNNSSYNTYEINLILANNTRLNVTDSGHKKSTISHAKKLSDFLDVPLLNRI